MQTHFLLDDRGEPVIEPDAAAWRDWFDRTNPSLVRTPIGSDAVVLTFFRGVGEVTASGRLPALFETRVFGGVLDDETIDDQTRGEALTTHARLAEWCRAGAAPDYGLSDEQLT